MDRPCRPLTCPLSATNRHCWRSSEPVLMQRRRFSFPRCCCALLCCVVVLFSTRSPPHAVLLATDLSLPVVVRVLRGGARVTWVCWCWLLCCRGALALSPSSQSLVCRGYQGRSFACSEAWTSWCRCCGASCSKLLCPLRCLAMQGLGSR